MNNKISDKDKKDWQNFIDSKKKILNKDLSVDKELSNIEIREIKSNVAQYKGQYQ